MASANNTHQGSGSAAGTGITGGYTGNSLTLHIFIALLLGLSLYNAVELNVMIFVTFTRYKGLYFWSLIVASCGIIPYAIGFILKFYEITRGRDRWVSIVLLTIGWYSMVTGQSVVLWSRLHLIVRGNRGRRFLRWTMIMIIVDAIIFHIPTTVLTFGSNGAINVPQFVRAFNIYEKAQMVGFFIQEVILSSIYILETVRILRTSLQPHTRNLLYQLFVINIVIILMDLALLGLEFANLYILEATVKGVVYSVKLKLEFAVLGKLVSFVTGGATAAIRNHSGGFAGKKHGSGFEQIAEFPKPPREVTHVEPTVRRKSYGPRASDSDVGLAIFEHIESANRSSKKSSGPDDIELEPRSLAS